MNKNNGISMIKKVSLPIALAVSLASTNSFAQHCETTWRYIPVAWETIYSYRNVCAYSIDTYYISDAGDFIQVLGATQFTTSWGTDLDDVHCPSNMDGEITYTNLSDPSQLIYSSIGSMPLTSGELETKEERGDPTEWELIPIYSPPGCQLP